MSKRIILIIEDERDIIDVIKYNLEKEGFTVNSAMSGEEGVRSAAKTVPDLILLDLMLPGESGLDVCRKLKSEDITRGIPIVMLTAKSEDSDVVAGLETGASDYVIKPFSMAVLVARVRAALRRFDKENSSAEKPVRIRDLVIDPTKYEATAGGKSVKLTVNEVKIFMLLSRRPGRVFSRYQIVDSVHGKDYMVSERAIDVQIAGLRKKLGPLGDCIETVRGVGYRIRE